MRGSFPKITSEENRSIWFHNGTTVFPICTVPFGGKLPLVFPYKWKALLFSPRRLSRFPAKMTLVRACARSLSIGKICFRSRMRSSLESTGLYLNTVDRRLISNKKCCVFRCQRFRSVWRWRLIAKKRLLKREPHSSIINKSKLRAWCQEWR